MELNVSNTWTWDQMCICGTAPLWRIEFIFIARQKNCEAILRLYILLHRRDETTHQTSKVWQDYIISQPLSCMPQSRSSQTSSETWPVCSRLLEGVDDKWRIDNKAWRIAAVEHGSGKTEGSMRLKVLGIKVLSARVNIVCLLPGVVCRLTFITPVTKTTAWYYLLQLCVHCHSKSRSRRASNVE